MLNGQFLVEQVEKVGNGLEKEYVNMGIGEYGNMGIWEYIVRG